MPSLTKVQTGFVEAQGALPLSSGTAAAPGLKFSDHDGTGMFSPSTGVIAFSTSGLQQALSIHSNGELISANGTLRRNVSDSSFTVSGDTASNTGANINLYGASHSTLANVFRVRNGSTETLRVNSAGNIGIGNDGDFGLYTAADDRNLILGTGSSSSGIQIHSSTTGYGGVYFGDTTSGTARYTGYMEFKHGTNDDFLRFGTSSGEKLRIDSSGRLLKSGQAALTSTSLNHPIQVAAASDANAIAIIGRAADDIAELSYYEADKSTKLGEVQYRQDHANIRHRVGDIRFATGGTTERLRIFSDGNVRIGDDSISVATVGSGPTLAINGTAPEITLRDDASGNPYAVMRTNDYGSLTLEADQGNAAANSTIHFRVDNTERMRINSSYLLYGDTASDLSSTHATMFCGTNHAFQYDGNTGTYLRFILGAANGTVDIEADARSGGYPDLRFITYNDERLRITSGGNVGIGTTDPAAKLTVDKGAPGGANQVIARFQAESSRSLDIVWHDSGSYMGFDLPGSHDYIFKSGGSKRLRITSAGLFGIGHDSPTAYGRMTVAMPSQSGGAAIQVANSSNGSGDGTTSNVVLRSVNNAGTQWADAEYRAYQHWFSSESDVRLGIRQNYIRTGGGSQTSNNGYIPLTFYSSATLGSGYKHGISTTFLGQISPGNSGNSYLHVKIDVPGGAMWWLHSWGYTYVGGMIHNSQAVGYTYGSSIIATSVLNENSNRGLHVYRASDNNIVMRIYTAHGTSNAWGYIAFEGGFDGICGDKPDHTLRILAYTWSSSSAAQY